MPISLHTWAVSALLTTAACAPGKRPCNDLSVSRQACATVSSLGYWRRPSTGPSGSYTRGVVNGQVFGPTLIPIPAGASNIPVLIDLAASPAGGYLLLFESDAGDPAHITLFAQELDAKGVPQGKPVVVAEQTGGGGSGIAAAAASLPNGRWIVAARLQTGDPLICSERLVGTILGSN